ncbi:MAG: hypothetical protein NC818_00125 [Candidatus Omnitrophica bacterium]|nr:hypothetical protein [Candidatus Omnitrophota bacterium]
MSKKLLIICFLIIFTKVTSALDLSLGEFSLGLSGNQLSPQGGIITPSRQTVLPEPAIRDRDISYIEALLPYIAAYLGVDEIPKDSEGSYFYNTLYWLTLPLVDRFSFDAREVGKEVERRIENWKRQGIEVSSSWKEIIRGDVRRDFAARQIIQEMLDNGLVPTISSVISWMSDPQRAQTYLSPADISFLIEELQMRIFLKEKYPDVLGEPGLTYQRENLSEKEFLLRIMKDKFKFVLDMYTEYSRDGKTYGFILDSNGGMDTNIAAMGMGLVALTLLEQKIKEGVWSYDDFGIKSGTIERMIGNCLNTMEEILNRQPQGEWVEYLLKRFPYPIVKALAAKTKEELVSVNLLDIYTELLARGDLKDEQGVIGNDLKDKVLTEEDIENILKIADTPEIRIRELEKIEKYGWGGLWYHFISPDPKKDLARSKKDVEISTMDSALLLLYAKYAGVYFGGSIKDTIESMLKRFPVSDNSPFYISRERGYCHGWRVVPVQGDTPTGFLPYDYHGDERLILDILRLSLLSEGEITSEDCKIYVNRVMVRKTREGDSVPPAVGFWGSYQGASWTSEYFKNLVDVSSKEEVWLSTNWFGNAVKALMANRHYALQRGYNPYGAVIGSQELPKYGYKMDRGSVPSIIYEKTGKPPDDGERNFAPSQVGVSYLPFESTESLWVQYISNPKLARGLYGFRESYTPGTEFVSPSNYTLNEVGLLLKIENALTGLVWKTMMEDEGTQLALRRAGFNRTDYNHINRSGNLENTLREVMGNGRTLEDAEKLVQAVTDEVRNMVLSQDESKLSYFREYVEYNDQLYEKALNILQGLSITSAPQLAVKVAALKFVIYKNQKFADEMLEAAKDLIKAIKYYGCIEEATSIISSYDYEAVAMWKDWRKDKEYIYILDENSDGNVWDDVSQKLSKAVATDNHFLLVHSQLEEYLTTTQKLYTILPSDSGVISALLNGADYPGGHVKGLRELRNQYGLYKAMEIMAEEFKIQASLRPYAERLLGRKLDLTNPDGKDAGFLSALAHEVKGGLENPKAGELTIEQMIWKMEFTQQLMNLFQRGSGHKFLDLMEEDSQDARWYYYWQSNLWHDIARSAGLPGFHPPGTYHPRYYIWNIQRTSGVGYPANYLVSPAQLPLSGEESIEVRGELRIPLLYGDLTAIDRINLQLKAGSGQFDEIEIRDRSGRRVVFKMGGLSMEKWYNITLPVYGIYYGSADDPTKPTWLQDSTWARWLTLNKSNDANEKEGFFWRLRQDGYLGLKEEFSAGGDIYVALDEHVDWGNISEIVFRTFGTMYVKGIYQYTDERIDISNFTNLVGHLGKGGAILFRMKPGVTISVPGTDNPGYSHAYRPGLNLVTEGGDALIIDMKGNKVRFVIPAIGPNIFEIDYYKFINEIMAGSVGYKLLLWGPKECRKNI